MQNRPKINVNFFQRDIKSDLRLIFGEITLIIFTIVDYFRALSQVNRA